MQSVLLLLFLFYFNLKPSHFRADFSRIRMKILCLSVELEKKFINSVER